MEGYNAKTYTLKVRISCCHGCYNKLDKLLQKNQGVVKYEIDKENDRVLVKGIVDHTRLIKDIEKIFPRRKVELDGQDGPQNQAAETSDHGHNSYDRPPEEIISEDGEPSMYYNPTTSSVYLQQPEPWCGYYNPPMLYGMSPPPPPAYHYPQVMPIARPPPPPYGHNYSYY